MAEGKVQVEVGGRDSCRRAVSTAVPVVSGQESSWALGRNGSGRAGEQAGGPGPQHPSPKR